jgi:hypothetical protein
MKQCILLCCAFLVAAVPAVAQEDAKFSVLVDGGLSLPQKPDVFKDVWSQGFNVGGGVGYRFSRHFAFQALVHYDRFSFDEGGFLDLFEQEFGFDPNELGVSVDVQGAETTFLSLSAELKASFVGDSSKVSPYVVGGGGVSQVSIGDTELRGTFMGIDLPVETLEGESETNAMATFGGGVDIPLGGRAGVYVEGRYHIHFTSEETTDFVSFRVGLRFGL